MASDAGEVYDRWQKSFDVSQASESEIKDWMKNRFTNYQTEHSGVVDLTKDHTILEYTGRGSQLRSVNVKGVNLSSRFDSFAREVWKLAEKDANARLDKLVDSGDWRTLKNEQFKDEGLQTRAENYTFNSIMTTIRSLRAEKDVAGLNSLRSEVADTKYGDELIVEINKTTGE